MDNCINDLNTIKNELIKEYEICISNEGTPNFLEKKERQIQGLKNSIEYLKTLPIVNGYDFLRQNLLNDDGVLLGWHSNIACWIMDNIGIVDYECRNDLAKMFIQRFFDIDYDWKKLVNPNNRKGVKKYESK